MRFSFALFLIFTVLLQPALPAHARTINDNEKETLSLYQWIATEYFVIRYSSVTTPQDNSLICGSYFSDDGGGIGYGCYNKSALKPINISRNIADYQGLWAIKTGFLSEYLFDTSVLYVHIGPVKDGKVRIKGTYVKERLFVDEWDTLYDVFGGVCPVADASVYIFGGTVDKPYCFSPTIRQHEQEERSFISKLFLLGDYIYVAPSQFGDDQISRYDFIIPRANKD